jgi:hypothetical protein
VSKKSHNGAKNFFGLDLICWDTTNKKGIRFLLKTSNHAVFEQRNRGTDQKKEVGLLGKKGNLLWCFSRC